MSIPIDRLQLYRQYGTTSATANIARPKKGINPFYGNYDTMCIECIGEGVYPEGADFDREGVTIPGSEVTWDTGQASEIATAFLGDGYFVIAYVDAGNSNKGTAIVGRKANGDSAPSFGTAVVFNNTTTCDVSICKLSSTTVAIAYCDDGGSDYLCAIIGTVTASTKAIAFGTEKELTAAAIAKITGVGTAICEPRDGVIAVAYELAGDTLGYVIAATFSSTTIGTPGTAVAFEGDNAVRDIAMTSHANGAICVAYADAETSHYYLTVNIGAVSSAAVVTFAGSSEALNSAASTEINIVKMTTNKVAIGYIAAGDPYIIVGTISSTTFTQGTAVAGESGTVLSCYIDALNDNALIAVYEEHNSTHYLKAAKVTTSGTTVTWGNIDFVVEATSQTCRAIALSGDEFVLLYDDTADSNKSQSLYGMCRDDLIDIRSSQASAAYQITLVPVYNKVANTSV